jgi:hypothetical protein
MASAPVGVEKDPLGAMGQGEVGHGAELGGSREAAETGGGDGGIYVPTEGLDDGPHALRGVGADDGADLVEVLADPGDRLERDGIGIGHEDVHRRGVVEGTPGAAESDGAGLGEAEEAEGVALLPNGAGRDAPPFGLIVEVPGEDGGGGEGSWRRVVWRGLKRIFCRAQEDVRGYDELQAEFFRRGEGGDEVVEAAGGEDDGVEAGRAEGFEIVELGAVGAETVGGVEGSGREAVRGGLTGRGGILIFPILETVRGLLYW